MKLIAKTNAELPEVYSSFQSKPKNQEFFGLTAGKAYKLMGESETSSGETWVQVQNDNLTTVRVSLSRFTLKP